MSAPKLRKWKMPCCAMTAPISSVIIRMIGTAFHATRSRCLTMEVKRKVCGRASTCRNAKDHRAAHLEQQQHVGADQSHGAADAFQGRHDAVFAARQRRQFVGAGLHLLEQAAVTVGQADQPRLDALACPGAQRAFDQPGAVSVDAFDLRDVDRDAARRGLGADRGFDQRLERARILRRPRSGRRKGNAVAARLSDQSACRHINRSSTGRHCRGP